MKIKNFIALVVLLAGTIVVKVQGGQRPTIDERVKLAMKKIAVFNLDTEKTVQTDSTLTAYYKAVNGKREEMRASGSIDREKMREAMQQLGTERDEKLKKVFSEDQFKK